MTVERKVKLQVVDADGHFIEPMSLAEYIEPKYRDVAPRRVRTPDGAERREGTTWHTYNPDFAGPMFRREIGTAEKRLIGLHNDKPTNGTASVNEGYANLDAAVTDPEARLVVMDEEGWDAAVLYPTAALAWIPDGPYHQAVNIALDNWLHDYCQADPRRLYGAVNICAIHDVDAACEEVRRCRDRMGFRAVFLRTTLAHSEDRWYEDQYDKFWATCQELDMAVAFHPFPGDSMYGSARFFDLIGPSPIKTMMRTPFNVMVDSMNAVMGMIIGGALERFPGLRFAILESSGGWLVPFLERLDYRFETLGHTLPHLKMKPSDYFRRQGWISFDPEEAALPLTAQWLGAERIIWGTDFPHPDAFYPGFVKMLNESIGTLSPADQERVRGLNAIDFYKL